MNKIYKVVWSKVKNCYVVVSDIAKNVITGAVKSAKVGSSMASGLAMGALMAFVITGNAMAADMTINADNKIGLTDAQVDWAVIGQSDFAVDGKLTINSNANSISAFGHTDNSEAKMTVTANGLEATTVNGTAVFVAGDHKNANLTINAGEGDVKITGTSEAHGIAVKSEGGSATINAADIKVTATENGVYAREDGAAITLNGANVTVESTNKGEQVAHKGHAVYVDKNAQVNIDATGDVTLKAADGKYAIGIESEDLLPKAVVNVIAKGNVDIEGQVFADQEATINVEGTNVTVNTGSKDAVSVNGGNANVTAETIKLTSEESDGVQVVEGTVKLQAKDVEINAGKYGVKVTPDEGGDVDVIADTIKIFGDGGGIYNDGLNEVSLNATSGVDVTGKVFVDHGGSVTVDAGAGDVTMDNVDAKHGTTVEISGKNVTLESAGADAIQGCDTTVTITADEKIEIYSDVKDGIESCASTVSLNAQNVEITSDGAWGVVGTADAGTDIEINATETVKITGEAGGIRNLAASDITVTATNKVEVTGNVHAEGGTTTIDGGNETKVTGRVRGWGYGNSNPDVINVNVLGKNITVDADGDYNVVQAVGDYAGGDKITVVIGDENTESVVIKNATEYGIYAQYRGSNVVVNSDELTIESVPAGIFAGNTSTTEDVSDFAVVDVNSAKTVIKATDAGIKAFSRATVNINGELDLEADKAIVVRGNSNVNINASGENKVAIDGDIEFQNNNADPANVWDGADANVDIKLTTSDSYLNGNIYATNAKGTEDVTEYVDGMKLELSNGATWTTDAKSFVNNLEVNEGNIVVENAQTGSITVDTLTGTSMHVDIASVKGQQTRASAGNNGLSGVITIDKIGDSDSDGKKDNVRVSVTTSGVNMNAANAKDYKDIVRVGNNANGYKGIVDEIDAKNTYISGDVKFEDDGNGGFKVVDTTLNGDVNVTGKFTAGEIVAENVYTKDEVDKQVADKFGEVKEDYKAADANLQSQINTNKIANDVQSAQISKLQSEDIKQNNILADHENRIDTLEGTVADHENRIDSLETTVGNLNGAVDKEVADRVAADAALKQEVTDAYKAADANLQSQINTNKIANDVQSKQIAGLQSKDLEHDKAIADNKAAIKAEADAREAADKVLQDNIDAEAKARQDADAAEAKARQDADAAETKARQDADAALKQEMTSEVGRLDNRLDKVDAKIDKVGAMAAAMASLKTMGYDPEAPTEIAVGIGQYRNETGIAIGAFHYPNKNFMLNFSLSTAGDEVMGGIGATWKIGRKR